MRVAHSPLSFVGVENIFDSLGESSTPISEDSDDCSNRVVTGPL